MKLKISNPYYHILFWLVVAIVLILVFGRSWENGSHAFYFIAMFLPVVMGTSYFFNYYLVPRFLLKKEYFWFGLYFFYTLVISLYLQMLVVFSSYAFLANFRLEEMGQNSVDDIFSLAFVMYMVVFVGSFLMMLQQLSDRQKEIDSLEKEKEKMRIPMLELTSNRQTVKIPYDDIIYIESLSDYIKVHAQNRKPVVSKEKISTMAETLPGHFVRIHRSFVVNAQKISRHTSNEVELSGIQLNIGRSYRKTVLPLLKSI